MAVVLLSLAERIVPRDQLEPLRQGILTFLSASSLDMVDKPRAEIEFKRARDMEATLPEPSRTLLKHVNDRAIDKLGPILLPAVESVKDTPEMTALSPERAVPPAALHLGLFPVASPSSLSRHLALQALEVGQEDGHVKVHLAIGVVEPALVPRPTVRGSTAERRS